LIELTFLGPCVYTEYLFYNSNNIKLIYNFQLFIIKIFPKFRNFTSIKFRKPGNSRNSEFYFLNIL
ncbi:hypothetical protein AP75_14070, partial [Kaistella haifensis DSM 19056]